MKKIIKFIINVFFKVFPIKENKIVFETREGKIEDNPLAIFEYLNSNYKDKYKLIWIVHKNTNLEQLKDMKYCYYRSFKGLYNKATSKYWITSICNGSIIKKRKQQVYIQTWHSLGAFKKMGYDIENIDYSKRATMDHVKDWDYFIASDKYAAESIRSSTGYKSKIEILGSPRTDKLINCEESKAKELKKKIGIPSNKKVVLYAPTFRDVDLNKDIIDLKIKQISKLDNIIVLVRLHPFLLNVKVNSDYNKENVINVSSYSDCNDLLLVSDVLITDYSSIIFDFAILNRPMIFFPYDYDEYVKYRGDFYLDYNNDLPGPIVYDEYSLTKILRDIVKLINNYNCDIINFNKKYNYFNDGGVCKRFCSLLNDEYFI